MRIFVSLISLGFLISVNSQIAFAQENRFKSLLERIDAVSDEALHIPPESAPILVGQDCEVDDDRVEELDRLLPLSAAARSASEKNHSRWGMPVPIADIADEEILHHREYIINHNSNLKQPTYASYQLEKSDLVSRTRVKCFRKDVRLDDASSATLDDYDEPRFDRGHLVPRADMNRSEAVMINTFVLSNMMPQHDNFNRGVWNKFEATVRAWTVDKGNVQIVTGAVFDKETPIGERDSDDDADRVRPLKQLGIPTHFFKIVLHQKASNFIETIAILLPHTDNEFPASTTPREKLEWLESHITSIDEIEAAAGYDFFPDLPDAQETAVERSIASGLWQ